MKRVLILGGSGFVGSHVCNKLVAQPWRITLPTRHETHARHLQHLPKVDVVKADVHDAVALRALVAGHDAVINLVAILHGDSDAFERTHVVLAKNLARACLDAGVSRLVHVSALGADGQAPEKAPSMYLRSKSQGEAVLRQAATEGLQLTLLRPSVIFGAQDKFLNLFARLQKLFPVIPLAGAQAKFQPVWVEDVAQAIVHCLDTPRTAGHTYELCGPQVFTLKTLVALAGAYSGVRGGRGRPVLALPETLGRLQARLMAWLPGPTLMSPDNMDSMRVDNVASEQGLGFKALGMTPASLGAIGPTYLAPLEQQDLCLALRRHQHGT
jgi:uncharacterized protein YbjT (DUF2867 family)